MGFSHSAVKAISLPLTQHVSRVYPKHLRFSEIFLGRTTEKLASSEVDLTLTFNPLPDPSFRFQPILEEEVILVGHPEIIGRQHLIEFDKVLELSLIILSQG